MFLDYLDKLIFALVSFGFGYFYGKSGGEILNEKIKKQVKKTLKGDNYGAVLKPRSQTEIDKEREKKFYDQF